MIFFWILFIFITIYTVVISVYYFHPTKKHYQRFEYKYDDLCIGIIKDNCPSNANQNYYNLISCKTMNSNNLGSVYISKTSTDNYYTLNFWITILDQKTKVTIGTLRWSNLYFQNTRDEKDVFKTTVPFVTSYISAASGILENLINCKVITDFRSNIRKIHIFSKNYSEKDIQKVIQGYPKGLKN
jgi:hypothetical protein